MKDLDNGLTSTKSSSLDGRVDEAPESWLPPGYEEQSDGIHFVPKAEGRPIFVCSQIRARATFANADGSGWGKLVAIRNPDGVWQEMTFFEQDLVRKPADVVGTLVDLGLKVGPDRQSRSLLHELLKQSEPELRMISIEHPGWVDDEFSAFLIGGCVLGDKLVLPLKSPFQKRSALLSVSGTADGWRLAIGQKCRGNPMMVLAASLSFSAPLLRMTGHMGGGLHFRGMSSSGKSTLLRVSASIWGSSDFVGQWRATSNGLEGLASAANDLLLPLDEIGEISSKELHEAIYMLANGNGKTRMTKNAALDETSLWRLALISSGEVSVREQLAKSGLGTMEGQEVRLIDVEADCRSHGVFDELHGTPDPGGFANYLRDATSRNFGAVGREFIRTLIRLFRRSAGGPVKLGKTVDQYRCDMLKGRSMRPDGVTNRVAERFALIGLAGELATAFGLTGWEKGDAKAAAKDAFLDWHERWIGGSLEAAQISARKILDHVKANSSRLPAIGSKEDGTEIGFHDVGKIYLKKETWSGIFPGSLGVTAAEELSKAKVLWREGDRDMRKSPRGIPGRPRLYTLHRQLLTELAASNGLVEK